MSAALHEHQDHKHRGHEHHGHVHAPTQRRAARAASSIRPTALASTIGHRLIRVATALVVLWLAVVWALWF